MTQKLSQILLVLILAITTANAESQKIVALVNNEPITLYEFQSRKKMIMILNNVKDVTSSNIEKQLNKISLNSLIEDELLYQHSKKVGAKISEEEINSAIASIEERNKMPRGHLINTLKSNMVVESFRAQVKAELIKSNILSYMSKSINVTPREIDSLILSNDAKDVKISAKVFTSTNKDSATMKKMHELRKNLKNCKTIKDSLYKDFANLDIIDENLSALDNQSQTIIKDLNIGESSNVFETTESFKLILLCNKTIDTMSDEENNYVVNLLTNKKMSQKAKKFFSDMRKRAYIQILVSS
jgi:hypothetical protein